MAHTIGTITARRSTVANPDTSSVSTLLGETVLCVLIKTVGASDRAGGSLTWGEFTLTQANSTQKAAASPECGCELWYLVNPPDPATKTLTIPNTNAATLFVTIVRASAAGGGSSAFDAATGGNATSTNPTPGAMTVTTAGDFAVAITAGGWLTWAPSAQVGTIIANTDDGADGGGEQYSLSPAIGSFTLSWTFGTSDDWGAVAACFKEIPPVAFENFKGGMKSVSAGIISVGERIR